MCKERIGLFLKFQMNFVIKHFNATQMKRQAEQKQENY